ncbi:MAG: hypothetical protein WCP09_01810 [Candidatus Taylorbacteria bacterium]
METKTTNRLIVFVFKHQLRARRLLFRLYSKLTKNNRPSSYPYPSGDSYRALANHIHDETITFDPSHVNPGEIIFVSNPLLLAYLKNIHPKIKNPYILIEHNGDNDVGKEVADLLDENIIRFYAQDNIYKHEKITPIPIALENWYYYMNGIPSVYNMIQKKAIKYVPFKKNNILYRFSIHTNPSVRGPAHRYCNQHPLMETFTEMLPPTLHIRKLMTYKFVFSPPGNAIESCRTWEALYVRTVPIVKDSVAMRYFESIGLPIWIIKEWNELDGLTEFDLARRYDNFIKKAKWDALHMDFWKKLINEDKKRFFDLNK